jgi:cephalosporin hydroxylase
MSRIMVGNNHYGHWLVWQDDPDWQMVKESMDRRASQYPVELKMLLAFLKSVKPSSIMEIGTHWGGTFWMFSQVVDPNGLMISLDFPTPQIDEEVRRTSIHSPREVKWIRADSHDPLTPGLVERALAGRSLDFLFIDGGHLYESVKRDYEMYSPFVRNGGWIGFHDINPSDDPHVDVNPFWRELSGFKFELSQYLPKNGIGILRKG